MAVSLDTKVEVIAALSRLIAPTPENVMQVLSNISSLPKGIVSAILKFFKNRFYSDFVKLPELKILGIDEELEELDSIREELNELLGIEVRINFFLLPKRMCAYSGLIFNVEVEKKKETFALVEGGRIDNQLNEKGKVKNRRKGLMAAVNCDFLEILKIDEGEEEAKNLDVVLAFSSAIENREAIEDKIVEMFRETKVKVAS